MLAFTFVNEHLNYKERPDLTFPVDGSAESLFVEIKGTKEKNVIVGVLYRPPDSNLNEFLSDLDHVLEKITKESKLVFLMGDWNLNLINHHCHKVTSDFLDLLYSRMFFPLITRPTRIMANKASLIDNIFTNDPLCPSINGLFLNDISDHLPIFSLVLNTHNTGDKDKYVIFREKNAHSLNAFKDDLGKLNWAELPGLDDPSCAYKIFIEKYVAIYHRFFPLKRKKAKRFNFRKPWFTKGLAKSVKKNILYKCFLNNPNSSNGNAYKSYKNKLTHSLRVAKRLYSEKQIERLKSNVKAKRKVLNEILNRNKGKRALPSVFRVDSHEIADSKKIANLFCKYFTNIGPNLASKIPASEKSHSSFLPPKLVNSIFREVAGEEEIIEICGTCRSGSAVGHNNISMSLIKDSIDKIIFPITGIINLSITSGIVPNQLKIARVIPLFKSGEQDIFTNYRLVSVLPAFSKILERVMYNRLLRFLNAFKILSDNQYGFRKHHSTAYALACLYDKISSAIENKEYTVGIFIDLSKAFDTVDHHILISKLEHYGVRSTALRWFESYLSGRQQYVEFNGVCSEPSQIKCGVIRPPPLSALYK